MSYYHLPHPWNPGYSIPNYVMAEPPGRGTFTTAMLPRGTIPNLIPDYLAVPVTRGAPSSVGGVMDTCLGFCGKTGGVTSERSQGQRVGFAIGAGMVGAAWLLFGRRRKALTANPARRRRRRR